MKKRNLYKKLHKWPGLILSFILLYYSFSGILMNHRDWISGIDVKRHYLPEGYQYRNWNNAALKGSTRISPDSVLVYGSIGIWLTDSSYSEFTSFNCGLPEGSDNRKIFDLHYTANGSLYTATLFGLYGYDRTNRQWKCLLPEERKTRFTAIESAGDTLYVLSRSHLYTGTADGIHTKLVRTELKAPDGYDNRVSLFQTLWQIHSGEILGLPGKFFVDLLGLITAFLSITGIVYFFAPSLIKRQYKRHKVSPRLAGMTRWSLKWHNKTGAWTFVLLIILYFTGMFLRPPLLLTMAGSQVAPLRFSHLDQPNPWYDKLRDLLYDPVTNRLLLSTSDGMYSMDRKQLKPEWFSNQPPVSVMGINAFEKTDDGAFLVGSFSGLFLWNPSDPVIRNLVTGQVYHDESGGRPIGDLKVTGLITGPGGAKFVTDYNAGILPLASYGIFPEMPGAILENSAMSLWNVSLEFHTGRIFEGLLSGFYILLVPLTGLASITVVLSGYLLWRKKYRHR